MTVRANITVSADGYMAGPDQSVDNPMGVGAGSLHDWIFKLRAWRETHGMDDGEDNASTEVADAGRARCRRIGDGTQHVRRWARRLGR